METPDYYLHMMVLCVMFYFVFRISGFCWKHSLLLRMIVVLCRIADLKKLLYTMLEHMVDVNMIQQHNVQCDASLCSYTIKYDIVGEWYYIPNTLRIERVFRLLRFLVHIPSSPQNCGCCKYCLCIVVMRTLPYWSLHSSTTQPIDMW